MKIRREIGRQQLLRMRIGSSEEQCVHWSRGHIGNCKSRALVSNLKKPMNSLFLSSFAKCPAKQKLRSTSFLSPRSRNARPPLVWTCLLGFSSATPSFLSLASRFLPHLLQVGWRWGRVYNLEKQNTEERESACTRWFIATAAVSFPRPAGIYRYRAYVSWGIDDSLWMNGNCLYNSITKLAASAVRAHDDNWMKANCQSELWLKGKQVHDDNWMKANCQSELWWKGKQVQGIDSWRKSPLDYWSWTSGNCFYHFGTCRSRPIHAHSMFVWEHHNLKAKAR